MSKVTRANQKIVFNGGILATALKQANIQAHSFFGKNAIPRIAKEIPTLRIGRHVHIVDPTAHLGSYPIDVRQIGGQQFVLVHQADSLGGDAY